MSDYHIRFENISKSYGDVKIIENLELNIEKGEFISLLGPSGSGKTTLLMMLAGFEGQTGGNIWLNEKSLNDLPSYKRNIGVVFQNYALFPHMSVGDNIAFPLKMRGVSKADIQTKVTKALEMVQLLPMKDRKPSQLSGGQQQRIALARALVFEPEVVLMDEPLGALDKQLREQMQLDIRELHKTLGLTIVFVTHDQQEALTMSDRIAVFNKGKIEQIGTPREIYDHPATRFVAEFIGETNLFEGEIAAVNGELATVRTKQGQDITVQAQEHFKVGQEALVSVRPGRIDLSSSCSGAQNSLHAKVKDSVYLGDHLRIQLDEQAHNFVVHLGRKTSEWDIGSEVVANFNANDCWTMTS
ncbi:MULTISPECIES: ABC transporter ATP-binding protein [Vitreoscilla]|uniref:Spermidine/putrescine import ATP-binding protein PotA n=1 Tax=Vitreoscilla stercoraria TaxID=61 RepID=A0ABY4E6Q3_VITST|nr:MULTISPECIES: ABC transporter ATP-binding protein [Vitreoscilla]AUZ04914.2 putrescine/spermidine ABC transporter ATP-binding protein [Vitreoscilla sp. C1]UOO91435.1 ABC transporter ATP-binding protein [Vitreoscilla stercoraria]